MNNPYGGFQIVESKTLVIKYQYRFPKSKRRRIRKKWKKDLKNWKTKVDPQCYFLNNQIICHPEVAEKLRYAMLTTNNSYAKLSNEPPRYS